MYALHSGFTAQPTKVGYLEMREERSSTLVDRRGVIGVALATRRDTSAGWILNCMYALHRVSPRDRKTSRAERKNMVGFSTVWCTQHDRRIEQGVPTSVDHCAREKITICCLELHNMFWRLQGVKLLTCSREARQNKHQRVNAG